jgi:hypothetical protein
LNYSGCLYWEKEQFTQGALFIVFYSELYLLRRLYFFLIRKAAG